jgi:hypothetical protein
MKVENTHTRIILDKEVNKNFVEFGPTSKLEFIHPYILTLKPFLLSPNSKRSENSLNILIAPYKGSFIP